MPDKTVPLILALSGALVALVGMLLRLDMRRAAGRGPLWLRRFLSAGLVFLASLGISLPRGASAGPAAIDQQASDRQDLVQDQAWLDIERVWAEAAAVASGSKGPFPFDRAGKEKLQADLKRARTAVEGLVTRSLLSKSEGLLLISDLDRLQSGVAGHRPTELKQATCYKPMAYRKGRDTLTWLEGRLPLLEKMSREKRLKPAVVDKVLARFEQDLAILADPKNSHDLDSEQRRKADRLVAQAKKTMAAIRRAMKPVRPKPPPTKTCYAPMKGSGLSGPEPATRLASLERLQNDQRFGEQVAAKIDAHISRQRAADKDPD